MILAHSLSGHLVLQNINSFENVSGIVCVGTPPLSAIDDIPKAFTSLGGLMHKELWSDIELNEIVNSLARNNQQTIREILLESDPTFRKALTTQEFFEGFKNEIGNLQKTNIKVSLLFSKDDGYINLSYCEKLDQVIKKPQIKTLFLGYGGHLPFFNYPEKFYKVICDLTNL